jgi:hypothetical protein
MNAVRPQSLQTKSVAAADTIRILVATDNHVGYAERDPVRGDDSYTTFNEIMELARERDVPPRPSHLLLISILTTGGHGIPWRRSLPR